MQGRTIPPADKVVHLGKCKIALIVEADPAGGFTTDTGNWGAIATRGKAVLDLCASAKERTHGYAFIGGAGPPGANRRLNIIAFAKNSAFDRALTEDPLGGVVDGKGPMVLLNASRWAGNWSQS